MADVKFERVKHVYRYSGLRDVVRMWGSMCDSYCASRRSVHVDGQIGVMTMLYELSSNQYWGGLNRRFDKRVRRLSLMGIYNVGNKGWPSKRLKWDWTQEKRVPRWIMTSQFVMHADRRAWNEMLEELIIR